MFEQENLDTADTDNDLMISIIESIAQTENDSRSNNIKWVSNKKQPKEPQSFIIENVMVTRMIQWRINYK